MKRLARATQTRLGTSGAARVPRSPHWRWAVLGALLGALVATTLWAPARWLAAGLHLATSGKVQLLNPRGTVWQGNAGLMLSDGAHGNPTTLPGRLDWQLRPRFSGLHGRLNLPCCAATPVGFVLQHHDGALRLGWQDAVTQWPATLLTGLGAPWNTLKPEGTLTLRTQKFAMSFRPAQLDLSGGVTLDATDMSSSLSTLRPMGSYRLTLTGGNQPSLLLSTTEGALQLSGSGLWTGRGMRFNGEASAAAGSEAALANLLNIIGRRDGARSIINLS